MNKKQIVILLGSICLVLLLAAILLMGACAPEEAAPEVTTWKFAAYTPETSPYAKSEIWYCDELGKRSNGRLVMDTYFGQALLGSKEILPPPNLFPRRLRRSMKR